MNKEKDIKNVIDNRLKLYEMAYEELGSEEKRTQYMGRVLTEILFLQNIKRLIKKYEGNPEEEIQVLKIMENDVARNVQMTQSEIPEYDVKFEDDDMTLCTKSKIEFRNSLFANSVTEYVAFIKDKQTNIVSGCDFYGNLVIPEMSHSGYKRTLFQALKKIVETQIEKADIIPYLGRIKNGQEGYYLIQDMSEEKAIKDWQKQKEERRKKNINLAK